MQIKCMTLFVTHYPSLAGQAREGVAGNYHLSFMEADAPVPDSDVDVTETTAEVQDGLPASNIMFLYKCVRGAAGRSYGLNVARLARCGGDRAYIS